MAKTKKQRRQAVATGASCVAVLAALLATTMTVVAGGSEKPVAEVEAGDVDWAAVAAEALAAGGFGFAGAAMDGKVLTITGDAPDAEAREAAYAAGIDAVRADRKHLGTVLAFGNEITVAGTPVPSVPDAASALGEEPEAGACQSAYDTLLDGRVINFNSGSALISQDSTPLLDALSAVAVRCVNYRVEVRGHTDSDGDATANQALSERRAQAVADYLVRNSVNASQLGVTGLGETEPRDRSGTEEANARNRRIEFKVAAQPAP
jgi:outer membrane protein OmpA-like peptidoglycan-associated protein